MKNPEPSPEIVQFISRLENLDSGGRARFKRNAGKTLAEAREVLGRFYSMLPQKLPGYALEPHFLVATLFPLAANGKGQNLGSSLRQCRSSVNAKGLDRRTERLLDADSAQLPFRLRQTVHFIQSNRRRVDWALLLNDLLAWNHPARYVQQRWAESYFAPWKTGGENGKNKKEK